MSSYCILQLGYLPPKLIGYILLLMVTTLIEEYNRESMSSYCIRQVGYLPPKVKCGQLALAVTTLLGLEE